jgi:hypothetical protein
MRPNRSDLPKIYGPIVGNTWARQNEFLGSYPVPEILQGPLSYAGRPTKRITMNKDMIPAFSAAMQMVIENNLVNRIKSYDGCFNIRNSRGSEKISNHAYALAIDINDDTNKLGEKPQICLKLVHCFEEAGFVWGGTWKRPDGMHFQFVTEK